MFIGNYNMHILENNNLKLISNLYTFQFILLSRLLNFISAVKTINVILLYQQGRAC